MQFNPLPSYATQSSLHSVATNIDRDQRIHKNSVIFEMTSETTCWQLVLSLWFTPHFNPVTSWVLYITSVLISADNLQAPQVPVSHQLCADLKL